MTQKNTTSTEFTLKFTTIIIIIICKANLTLLLPVVNLQT